jgi:hypothetical protein
MHGKLNLNKEALLQNKFTTDGSSMLDQEPKNQGSLDVMFTCPVRAMTRSQDSFLPLRWEQF